MIKELKRRLDRNDTFLRLVATYLNKYERLVNAEIMEEITGGDKSLDERAFSSFLASAFIDDAELEREILRDYFSISVAKLDADKYKNDPYYKNIKIPNKKLGNWTLGWQKYAPYEGFVRDDYLLLPDLKDVPMIGFFDEEFHFPTVFEDGVEWMAIKPNEIETMREPIARAHGHVLTLGLGLGYFTYMVSEKEEVTDITVVEVDNDVIDIFNSVILPQFPHKDKVHIVKADAFDFLKDKTNDRFDYIFADMWHDTSDGTEMYIKLKKLENDFHAHFEYWIESSIIAMIRSRFLSSILEGIKTGECTFTYDEILQMLDLNYLSEFIKVI